MSPQKGRRQPKKPVEAGTKILPARDQWARVDALADQAELMMADLEARALALERKRAGV